MCAGGGILGLTSVKLGSDGQWTLTQISCHSGRFPLFSQSRSSSLFTKKADMNSSSALIGEMKLWYCAVFSALLRSCDWHGLLSFWWQPVGDLLRRWNGQLFGFYCPFFPLCGTSTPLLDSVAPGRQPLGLCYSKSSSSQLFILGCRNLLSVGLCFQTRQLGLPEGAI